MQVYSFSNSASGDTSFSFAFRLNKYLEGISIDRSLARSIDRTYVSRRFTARRQISQLDQQIKVRSRNLPDRASFGELFWRDSSVRSEREYSANKSQDGSVFEAKCLAQCKSSTERESEPKGKHVYLVVWNSCELAVTRWSELSTSWPFVRFLIAQLTKDDDDDDGKEKFRFSLANRHYQICFLPN